MGESMNILVTGANGFIAKNLIAELNHHDKITLMKQTRDTSESELDDYCSKAQFVFHLAGVNRPDHQSEFITTNRDLTSDLLQKLKKHKNYCPVLLTSSIQAELENPYGESKKAGEELLFKHHNETGAKVLAYRLPNVFGKWSKPNYNSVVATFCHNIARGLTITVNDRNVQLTLVYIDDVIEEFVRAINDNETKNGNYCKVSVEHSARLGEIVDSLVSFKESREHLTIPNIEDPFEKKLYSTYLSFLPEDEFSYDLKMNVDERGSFTEFIKTADRGQVSVNISKPGITKGNHWHHTKNEKFLVVSGKGVIRFRKYNTNDVIEYYVSGEKLEVVDIPTGYTHNIENLGDIEMVTIMWANELFDPEKPDTYFMEV